jgi:DDE family transposase
MPSLRSGEAEAVGGRRHRCGELARPYHLVPEDNLPAPGWGQAEENKLLPADVAEVVRLYELRSWVEQSYKQVKQPLGRAHYQLRKDLAIRRHWQLVMCAFTFC